MDISEYIDLGEKGMGASLAPVPLSAPTIPPSGSGLPLPRFPLPAGLSPINTRQERVKPTVSDRALWKVLGGLVDQQDFTFGLFQASNAAVERSLNADGWQGRLPTLRLRDLARYVAGQGPTLYVRPYRAAKNPEMLLRIDADAHQNGQSVDDAAAFVQQVRRELIPSVHCESSPNGHSGYVRVVEFPTYEFRDEKGNRVTRPMRADRMNEFADRLQDALRRWASAWGYDGRCGVELVGRLNVVARQRDEAGAFVGPKVLVSRGGHMRCPRPATTAGVLGLMGSRITYDEAMAIIESAPAARRSAPALAPTTAPATPPTTAPASTSAPAPAPRKAGGDHGPLAGTGDKFRDSARAVSAAVRQLGPDADDDALLNLANEVYEAAGMHGGRRDPDRDRRFLGILNHFRETWDPERGSGSPLWYDEGDLLAARRLLASMVSNAAIEDVNNKLRGEHDSPIDRDMLADVSCCVLKNAMADRLGHCPLTAIVRMLASHDIQVSMRQAGACVRLLVRHCPTLIQCLHNGKYCPGMSRAFAAGPTAFSLPFLSHLKPAESDRRAGREQVERYALRAGSGRGITSDVTFGFTTYLSSSNRTYAGVSAGEPAGVAGSADDGAEYLGKCWFADEILSFEG